jgi:hypothetical protein
VLRMRPCWPCCRRSQQACFKAEWTSRYETEQRQAAATKPPAEVPAARHRLAVQPQGVCCRANACCTVATPEYMVSEDSSQAALRRNKRPSKAAVVLTEHMGHEVGAQCMPCIHGLRIRKLLAQECRVVWGPAWT